MNFIGGAWSASWPSASLRRDAIASLSCAGFLFGSIGIYHSPVAKQLNRVEPGMSVRIKCFSTKVIYREQLFKINFMHPEKSWAFGEVESSCNTWFQSWKLKVTLSAHKSRITRNLHSSKCSTFFRVHEVDFEMCFHIDNFGGKTFNAYSLSRWIHFAAWLPANVHWAIFDPLPLIFWWIHVSLKKLVFP